MSKAVVSTRPLLNREKRLSCLPEAGYGLNIGLPIFHKVPSIPVIERFQVFLSVSHNFSDVDLYFYNVNFTFFDVNLTFSDVDFCFSWHMLNTSKHLNRSPLWFQ